MKKFSSLLKAPQAQAVVEVAIFGAMVIFLIGLMVSQSVNASFNKQAYIRVFNEAKAWALANNVDGGERGGNTFIIIEDRLAPAVSKYGDLSRQPVMASFSMSLSANMYELPTWNYCSGTEPDTCTPDTVNPDTGEVTPGVCTPGCGAAVNWADERFLPKLTVRINGVEKIYTTAGSKVVANCPQGSGFRTHDAQTYDGTIKKAWEWKTVQDDKVKEVWDDTGADIAIYDVDQDDERGTPDEGTEETVLSIPGLNGCGPSVNTCNVIDPNEGDYDSRDKTQGLQAHMTITTTVDGTLKTSNYNQSITTVELQQGDTICRYFKTNKSSGDGDPFCKTLTYTPSKTTYQ